MCFIIILSTNKSTNAHGYHPLTGELPQTQLRDGTIYRSKKADIFIKSLWNEFLCDFPNMPLYLHGDNGFASADLYEILEDKSCRYSIRLKKNANLYELAGNDNQRLYRATKFNQIDYVTTV